MIIKNLSIFLVFYINQLKFSATQLENDCVCEGLKKHGLDIFKYCNSKWNSEGNLPLDLGHEDINLTAMPLYIKNCLATRNPSWARFCEAFPKHLIKLVPPGGLPISESDRDEGNPGLPWSFGPGGFSWHHGQEGKPGQSWSFGPGGSSWPLGQEGKPGQSWSFVPGVSTWPLGQEGNPGQSLSFGPSGSSWPFGQEGNSGQPWISSIKIPEFGGFGSNQKSQSLSNPNKGPSMLDYLKHLILGKLKGSDVGAGVKFPNKLGFLSSFLVGADHDKSIPDGYPGYPPNDGFPIGSGQPPSLFSQGSGKPGQSWSFGPGGSSWFTGNPGQSWISSVKTPEFGGFGSNQKTQSNPEGPSMQDYLKQLILGKLKGNPGQSWISSLKIPELFGFGSNQKSQSLSNPEDPSMQDYLKQLILGKLKGLPVGPPSGFNQGSSDNDNEDLTNYILKLMMQLVEPSKKFEGNPGSLLLNLLKTNNNKCECSQAKKQKFS